MMKRIHCIELGGGLSMCVNDKVEVISTSHEDIYGKVGTVLDIVEGDYGTDVRVKFDDETATWIDSEDVVLY